MDFGIVTLILNIVLIVFAVIGILFGLKRGVKKAGIRFALFIVSIIASLILTPIISHTIMNISISTSDGVFTINDYLIHMIASSPEMEEIMSLGALKELIQQLPLLFGNLLIFLLLIYIIGFIGYICYTIISHILFKKKNIKNPEYTLKNNKPVLIETNVKQKKYRIFGGLVGGLQGILLLFFTLVPVSGLVKTFNELLKEPVSAEEVTTDELPDSMSELLHSYLPPEALGFFEAYNNSVYGKINNALPLTDICFDTISSVKVNGEKIVLRNEIKTVVEIYDNVAFLANLDLSGNIEDLDFDKIERAIGLVFDIKTFKAVIPDLIPYLLKQLKVEDTTGAYAGALNIFIDEMVQYFEEQPDVANTLKSDLLSIVGIARVCVESGLVTELSKNPIDQEKVLLMIKGDDGEFNTPKQVINNFFNSSTIKKLLAEGCNFAISELEGAIKLLVPEDERDTVSIGRIDYSKINWASISDSFLEVFKSAFGIYEEIKDLNTEEIDFDTILNEVDTRSVLVNMGNIIDKFKELAIFSATPNNTNIYNNIMAQLNKTELGDYIDFTQSSTNGFWVSNMTAVANLLDFAKDVSGIFKDIDEDTTDYQYYIDQIDFDKYEEAVESLCNCSLLTLISDDAITNLKTNVLDQELNLDLSTFEGKLINNLITNLAETGNITNEIKVMLRAEFNITKAFAQSGILNALMQENVNLNDVLVVLKNEDENGDVLTDVLTDNLFESTTLKTVFIEGINYALENIEKTLIEDEVVTECDLGRIDYSKLNWNTVKEEFKELFRDLLSFEMLEEDLVIGDTEIPVDMATFIKAIGKSIQDLRDFSIFEVSESNNIFDNIINIIKDNEEIKAYVDLSVLLEENAIEKEFEYVAKIFDNLVESELFSYLSDEEGITNQDLVNIAKNLTTKVPVEQTEKTRVAIIFESLLESKLVNNFLHGLFAELDDMLQDSIVDISESLNGEGGELVEISNLNLSALDDENENAKIVSTFENLFSFIASMQIDEEEDELNLILNTDLSLLGSFLDSISNLALFEAVEDSGQKGLYNNIIDILDSAMNKELGDMVDLSVAKEDGFTWNNELTTIKTSIDALFTIEIEVEVEGEPVNKKLIDCLDNINNILKINPNAEEGAKSEVYQVLYGILDSNIFKKIGTMLVDIVNDIVESTFEVLPEDAAPDFTNYSDIKEQKLEIIKIVEDYIKANNENVFDKLSDIKSMSDEEIVLLGNLINSFKENAYRTENADIEVEGVFKTAYDNVLAAYSEYASLLEKYDSKLDVDWVSILKVVKTLGNTQEDLKVDAETVEELKPQVVEILQTIYGEEETAELETKIDNIINSLEDFENSDSVAIEENVEVLLEDVANVEIVVDLLETLEITIPVVNENLTQDTVINKIDNLEISADLKASLKNIFGVA